MTILFTICFLTLNELRAEQTLSFLLGVLVSDYQSLKEKIKVPKTTITLFLTGITMLAFKQIDIVRTFPKIIVKFIQLMIKLPLGIVLINIVHLMMNNKHIKKTLNVIGKYSYEIFLTHGIAILIFKTSNNNILNIILFIFITIISSYILNKITNILKNQLIERN